MTATSTSNYSTNSQSGQAGPRENEKSLRKNIPLELQQRAQWVAWKFGARNNGSKPAKIPVDPKNGHNASTTNADMWGTFEQALQYAVTTPGTAGIGYVFTADDPYTGIDFDDCFDETDNLTGPALTWVPELNSYTERSISGKGLKAIVKATLGGLSFKNSKANVEAYDRERFFALTGNVYGNCTTINECQSVVTELHEAYYTRKDKPHATVSTNGLELPDEEITRRIRESKSHLRFEFFWRGEWQHEKAEHEKWTQSEADLSFCAMLSFWTGRNNEQVERLFRASGMFRPVGKGDGYVALTVDKACLNPAMHSMYKQQGKAPAMHEGLVDPASGADACPWLDAAVAFIQKWAPRGYEDFYEAAAIFILSTIAARRVRIPIGPGLFTNLFILMVATTGLNTKSDVGVVAKGLIQMAGLDNWLTPDLATPEKFIANLAGKTLQAKWEAETDTTEKDLLRRELMTAAQRGWFYDEFGQHFDAMMRTNGTMAPFRSILRRLYDCPDEYEYDTITRGADRVEHAYLSLLGILTPEDVKPFAKKGTQLWGDGFLARFAFACAPIAEPSKARWPQDEVFEIPEALTGPLLEWDERLGYPGPTAILEGHYTNIGVSKVYDAYYAYNDALLDLLPQLESTDLNGNYIRLHNTALKIAALFASLEGSPEIEIKHWAKAQGITERWRSGLHRFYDQVAAMQVPPEEKVSTKRNREDLLLGYLKKRAGTAVTIGRIRTDNHNLDTTEIEEALQALVRAGFIKEIESNKTTKYIYADVKED